MESILFRFMVMDVGTFVLLLISRSLLFCGGDGINTGVLQTLLLLLLSEGNAPISQFFSSVPYTLHTILPMIWIRWGRRRRKISIGYVLLVRILWSEFVAATTEEDGVKEEEEKKKMEEMIRKGVVKGLKALENSGREEGRERRKRKRKKKEKDEWRNGVERDGKISI